MQTIEEINDVFNPNADTWRMKATVREFAKFLKENFDFDDYCIVGSLALVVYGIMPQRKLHDIDIQIFLPEDEDKKKKMLDAFALLTQASKTRMPFYPNDDKMDYDDAFFFTFGDFDINVFIMNSKSKFFNRFNKKNKIATIDGIKYGPLPSIFMHKLAFNRTKDREDFAQMANLFLSMATYDKVKDHSIINEEEYSEDGFHYPF